MAQNRYQLSGSSLAELGAKALREYGPSARIVSSERIPAQGFAGFIGKAYYEATVEVSDSVNDVVELSQEAGSDISIMDEASAETEDTVVITHGVADRDDAGSGEDQDFDEMIRTLREALREPSAAQQGGPQAPAVLNSPGAIVVVVGLGSDAQAAAAQLGATDALSWDLGRFDGAALHEAKRDLRQRQASAVMQEVAVIVTAPLNLPRAEVRSGADHPTIREADQLWVAVDVSRKVEDTQRWLTVVAENRSIDGALLINTEKTLTPETGKSLGVPVLTVDTVGI